MGPNDFVYAADVGRGIALACTAKDAPGKAFHVGGPARTTAPPTSSGRCAGCCRTGPSSWPPGPARRRRAPRVDLSASERILGYKPQYSLEQGIADYMEVVRRHGFWH